MSTPVWVRSDAIQWPIIEHELSGLGPAVSQCVAACLALRRADDRPDRLSVHLRPDCGVVYLELAGPGEQREEVGVVTIPRLESEYYDLPRTAESRKETWETAHQLLLESLRGMFGRLLTASAAVRPLCTDPGLRIVVVDYDDRETERDLPIA